MKKGAAGHEANAMFQRYDIRPGPWKCVDALIAEAWRLLERSPEYRSFLRRIEQQVPDRPAADGSTAK